MWFLQRRNMHKHSLIVVNLGLLIAAAHIGLLMCLFFVYHDVTQHLDLTILSGMNYRDIEFRVAVEHKKPFDKLRANGEQKKAAATTQKIAAKAAAVLPTKKIQPLPKMPAKSTQIASGSEKKAVSKKPFDKLRANGEVVKKAATKPSPAPVVQKVEEKIIEKKEAPKAEQVAKSPEQVMPAVQEIDHLDLAVSKDGQIDSSLAFFQTEYKALYENLSDQWAPPAGIPATSTCIITVVLDRQGQVDDMIVDSSSGMLVFDVAARSALSELEFPRFVWGKSITVTFSV